ncbi:MAG: hypothetical protein LAP61_14010 [Acidobacteriia bacterium]|nr:hypothetical protein [Terriglobia bacterium]
MCKFLIQPLCIILAAAQLRAADPAWRSKSTAEWTEQDAKEILSTSPWSKTTTAVIMRRRTEDELRMAGQMGQPRGVGNENVDAKGTTGIKASLKSQNAPVTADHSVQSGSQPIALRLRWENAFPVRVAELKAHEVEPPTSEDGYRIAVYGLPVPDGDAGSDAKQPVHLKNLAALKRPGRKDVKPVNVEVFQRDSEMVVVYLFPLSAEITEKDGHVDFQAQIGRVTIDQSFDLTQMTFEGKLEL